MKKELSSQYEALKAVNKKLINLWNMRNFYLEHKDNIKPQALTAQIGWTSRVLDNKSYEEYLLNQTNFDESDQPMGIVTYKLTESLPNDLKGLLPTPSEISQSLENLLENKIDDKLDEIVEVYKKQ